MYMYVFSMSSTNNNVDIFNVVSEDTTEKEDLVSDIFKLYHQCDLRLSLILYDLILLNYYNRQTRIMLMAVLSPLTMRVVRIGIRS